MAGETQRGPGWPWEKEVPGEGWVGTLVRQSFVSAFPALSPAFTLSCLSLHALPSLSSARSAVTADR